MILEFRHETRADRFRSELQYLRELLRYCPDLADVERRDPLLAQKDLLEWIERLLHRDAFLKVVPARASRPRASSRLWMAVEYLARTQRAGKAAAAEAEMLNLWGDKAGTLRKALSEHRKQVREVVDTALRWCRAEQRSERAALDALVESVVLQRRRVIEATTARPRPTPSSHRSSRKKAR